MSTIVDNSKIFWTVVLKTEFGQSFMQGCLVFLSGNLEVIRPEIEFACEQLPQFIHLIANGEHVALVYTTKYTYFRLFALHVVVLPCEKQSADLLVSSLSMTIVSLDCLVEDHPSFVALLLTGRFGPMMVGRLRGRFAR